MGEWRQENGVWQLLPAAAPRGWLQFVGGSYLATTPQLSYRRLLEALAQRQWAIQAWSYVPGFDHQAQANAAWRAFRQARPAAGTVPADLPVLRLGHSLGCKLHLLAPDNGRACWGLAALSFNNFSAERSVPLLAELGQQLQFRSEFSPSPQETLALAATSYRQPRNLLVRFNRDRLDQSSRLLDQLRQRPGDASRLVELPGDHLTPASGGFRRQVLGDWADDPSRQRAMERLADLLDGWVSDP